MVSFEVEPDALELAAQLAERQAEHFQRIRDHIDAFTVLDRGFVLGLFTPTYNEARGHGIGGMEAGQRIGTAVADKARESARGYRAVDQQVSEGLRGIGLSEGYELEPDDEPRPAPVLGPPGEPVTPYELASDSGTMLDPERVSDSVGQWSNQHLRDHRGWLLSRPDQMHIDATTDMLRSPYFKGLLSDAPDISAETSRIIDQRIEATIGNDMRTSSDWVQDSLHARSARALHDVTDLGFAGAGAYAGVADVVRTKNTLDALQDQADGPANTDDSEWAHP